MAKTALIADDSAFMRHVLSGIFKKYGFEIVSEATNGVEAIDLYRRYHPDVVTMDITMPEVDGLKAIKEIHSQDPKACILVVSAMGQNSVALEAFEYGASDFIVKPFQPDRIAQVLKHLGFM
jgi:two-component system chemotaxis response regulator CheY